MDNGSIQSFLKSRFPWLGTDEEVDCAEAVSRLQEAYAEVGGKFEPNPAPETTLLCLSRSTPVGTVVQWPNGKVWTVVEQLDEHAGPYYSGPMCYWFKAELKGGVADVEFTLLTGAEGGD